MRAIWQRASQVVSQQVWTLWRLPLLQSLGWPLPAVLLAGVSPALASTNPERAFVRWVCNQRRNPTTRGRRSSGQPNTGGRSRRPSTHLGRNHLQDYRLATRQGSQGQTSRPHFGCVACAYLSTSRDCPSAASRSVVIRQTSAQIHGFWRFCLYKQPDGRGT